MARKSTTDRSIRAQKTKRKLFQSAAKLVEKHGYDNVTIEDICRKANVSVGAYYHYYDSKTDIIVEIFRQIDDYYETKVTPLFTGDASADIDTFFRYYAVFHVDQGYEHTRMIIKAQTEMFLDKTRYMHVKLLELVEAAKAGGVFAGDADSELIAGFLLVVARGLLFDWSLSRGDYDMAEKMDKYITVAKRSFR